MTIPVKAMILYGLLDDILARLGAHILIIRGEDDARLALQCLGDCFYIHSSRDVAAAPAYEYSDSFASRFLLLTCYICAVR